MIVPSGPIPNPVCLMFLMILTHSVLTMNTAWSMFAAGASGDTGVRNELISGVHAKINSNVSSGVFPTTYSSRDGTTSGGSARLFFHYRGSIEKG